MEKRFTPGEWYYTGSNAYGLVYGPDHNLIVPHQPSGFTTDEQHANAKLIASAPNMLATLEEIFENLEAKEKHHKLSLHEKMILARAGDAVDGALN